MASRTVALWDVCRCFRGEAPRGLDWMTAIALANRTLTTPALMAVQDRFPTMLPPEVNRYLREIAERNRMRNSRLAAQLSEAVLALNADGILPVLMKGSAFLAVGGEWTRRLVSDLDILVRPEESERALACLLRLGYGVHFATAANAAHWYADLQRPDDAGMVDLQRGPPGHPLFYRAAGDMSRHCRLITDARGARAYIPSATYHAFLLIIHDQFQDSDYWTGQIDLRHLLDLRDLANSPEGIDWERLAAFAPGRLARNALETQLVALHALLGVAVPARLRTHLVPRLQHRRRMLQSGWPLLRSMLLPMTVFDLRNYRREFGTTGGNGTQAKSRIGTLPKAASIRFLFELTAEHRTGKV